MPSRVASRLRRALQNREFITDSGEKLRLYALPVSLEQLYARGLAPGLLKLFNGPGKALAPDEAEAWASAQADEVDSKAWASLIRALILEGLKCPSGRTAEEIAANPDALCGRLHVPEIDDGEEGEIPGCQIAPEDLGSLEEPVGVWILRISRYGARRVAATEFRDEERAGAAAGQDGRSSGA